MLDERLGEVEWSAADQTWVVPPSARRSFAIHIPGAEAPDAKLIPWARELDEHGVAFSRTIHRFVSEAAARWGREAAHLVDLKIEVVALHLPDRTGMVFFHCAEGDPAWRCDLIAGVPRNLGCDT